MRLKLTALVLLMSGLLLAGCQSLTETPTRDIASIEQMQKELDDSLAAAKQQAMTSVPPANVTAELLPALPLLQNAPVSTERFDISVDGVEARDFFIGLVKGTPNNIVVPPDLTGTLSLDLQNVTINEVMQIVRDTYGYDHVQKGNLYRVLPNGMRTEIFKIDYLNVQRMGTSQTQVSAGQVSSAGTSQSESSNTANSDDDSSDRSGASNIAGTQLNTRTNADFWANLSDTVSIIIGVGDGRRVVVSPQSGMVIVHARAGELRSVQDFLDKAELSLRRQVIIEAKILEVQLNDGFQAGVNWSAVGELGNGKNVIFGTGLTQGARTIDSAGNTTVSNAILNTPSAVSAGSNPVGGIFSAAFNLKDFNGLIDLLSTQGTVQVLSSPRISTVNNQKAVIKVGTDEFFVTEISTQTTTTSSSTTPTVDVELTPFFSGIALDVTPQISENGEVILHIHPTVSEVKDQTKTVVGPNGNLVLPLALSSIRETDSIVRAKNGQVVVIGGLMQNNAIDDNARTPLLGDIPWLGKAFQQKRQSSVKSELVILLKPVVADDAAWQDDLESSKQRFSEFQQVFQPGTFE
ncbi:MAG: pilus (MSHA type) biogenesis protein MshL [Pseudomonadales bacterium]